MARKKPTAPELPPEIIPRRLAFDMTPAGAVTLTFRRACKTAWEHMRDAHIADHRPTCTACGRQYDAAHEFLLQGHEIWICEPPTRIRLERIEWLCWECHQIVHFDRTRRHVDAMKIEQLVEHYCWVNEVDAETFWRDFRAVLFADQGVRDAFRPAYNLASPDHGVPVDYGPYAGMAEERRQNQQKWRQTNAGQLHTIKKFFARYTSDKQDEWGELPPDPGYYTYACIDHVTDIVGHHQESRAELAALIEVGDLAAVQDCVAELCDYGGEEADVLMDDELWLPSH